MQVNIEFARCKIDFTPGYREADAALIYDALLWPFTSVTEINLAAIAQNMPNFRILKRLRNIAQW